MKNIKYLKDFTKEDYQKLFNENDNFKELAYNEAIKQADSWVSDYLNAFKGDFANYSISNYEKSYIQVRNFQDFINDFYQFKKDYSCTEEQDKQYEKVLSILNQYEKEEDDEKVFALYDNFEKEAEKLKDLLLDSWVSEYTYWDHNDDELLNFIIEDIEANNYMEDYYIKDNDYSKLYILIPEHETIYKFNY